jgi:DNA-nicking Smr family endonuclease
MPDETALWRRVVRDVVPLRGRAPPPERSDYPLPNPPPQAEEGWVGAAPPKPLPPLDHLAGIDRASAQRLKRGRYPVEARLDLHGMTQEEAHRALLGFVAASRAAGRRCVLVVTGHGRMSGGILRHAVPRWLDEPQLRRHLLALAPARPQEGGSGALYLLLRRERAAPDLHRTPERR